VFTLIPKKQTLAPSSLIYNQNNKSSCFEEVMSEFQEKTDDRQDLSPNNKTKLDIIYYFFEKASNLKNYFPDHNLENIVKHKNGRKRLSRLP
jgi:hypothetical protein